MHFPALFSLVVVSTIKITAASTGTIYGVNLGGWLISEPWMNPLEWAQMGGESPSGQSCSDYVGTEAQLVAKLGQKRANVAFHKHWKTWFSQKDVDVLKGLGINSVRIPVSCFICDTNVV